MPLAQLKHEPDLGDGSRVGGFHGANAVAQLKPRFLVDTGPVEVRIPRCKCRGPIEAGTLRMQPFTSPSFPRRKYRGPIEDRDRRIQHRL